MLAITTGAVALAAWLYLLLGRGMFWRETHRCSTWSNCAKAQHGNGAMVVAVVPARNERATIGRCVASLLGQELGGTLHVIVVDDQSTDGTAEALAHICQIRADVGHHQNPGMGLEDPHSIAPNPGAISLGQPRLTVISGKALLEGWSGKVWAMQQGVEAARTLRPEYFLFTDADVVHAPDSVAKLVNIAEGGGYDLTSFMVRLNCESVAERLLIPAFVFFFFMLYPPRWIADPRKRTAGAAGGCMLVRPEALARAGGLEAIRGEVIDDCALARLIKDSWAGGRGPSTRVSRAGENAREPSLARDDSVSGFGALGGVWLGLSEDTVSVREYGSLAEIGRMIARTAFNQLHHSVLMLAGAMAGLAITFVVPVALVFIYPTQEPMWGTLGIVIGGAAWTLMTVGYLPMVRFYSLNAMQAVTLPLAASFYMGATVWSALKFWLGRGGEWKGRVQDTKT